MLVNIVNGSSPNPFNTAVATSFLEVGGEELLQVGIYCAVIFTFHSTCTRILQLCPIKYIGII